MDSLIISPTKVTLGERRRCPPTHEMTLASLSTDSSDVLNKLLEPENMRDPFAFLDKDVDASPSSEFHWNPNSSSRPPFKSGRIMPGTLTPSPSLLTEVFPAQETPRSNDHFDSKVSVIMPPQSLQAAAAPFARLMSMQERTAFLDGLAELSRGPPATVYTIHAHELRHIAESASTLGFHTGIVHPKTGTGEEGLLILGRDLGAVKDLLAKLSRDGTPQQSGIRAMAGGAVAGAVATFTGLALA
ncbi:hypothetical protein BJV74DRAFT_881016 [Russula compacta]|nr:hypothetical protein BJV74DRAFT_881016 [Russula compacta]